MKDKRTVKKFALAALLPAAFGILCAGSILLASATEEPLPPEATLIGDAEFKDVYQSGQVLTLPRAKLRVGDSELAATTVVIYPGGEAKKLTKVLLSEEGVYEIRYKATVGGYEVHESRYITVVGDAGASVDDLGPVISLDYAPFAEGALPEEIPVNCKFPVFAASAYDAATGAASVNVRVYYDYYDFETRYELDVSEGWFSPDKPGNYTIMYTAEDGFRNSSLLLETIRVTDTEFPLELSVEKPASAEDWFAGNPVSVAACTYGGGLGGLSLKIAAVGEDGEEIDCTNGSFRPMQYGDYRIVYTLTDAVGQEISDEYTVEVLYNTDPVFLTEAALPRYFLEDCEYTLPPLRAYDIAAESYIDTKITVTDGSGKTVISDGTFTPRADAEGKARVVYEADSAYGANALVYEIPVIKAFGGAFGDEVDMAAYFYGVNMTAEAEASGVFLTADRAGENASFEFIREIYADGASLAFGVDKTRNGFGKLSLYLEDAEDKAKSVKLSFFRGASSETLSYLYINDRATTMATATTFFSGADYLFSYDEKTHLLTEKGGIGNAYLTEYSDGTPFGGFPSGRIYFRVELEDVTGESAVCVKSINGQDFSSTTIDAVQPAIKFMEEYSNSYLYGDTLKLWKCFVIDVLDPRVEASMTVSFRENSTAAWQNVADVNGKTLLNCVIDEYVVRLDRYGEYRVTYTFEDYSNLGISSYVNFTVFDLTGPEISTDFPEMSTVSTGTHIDFPKVTVTDNSSGECKYIVFLTDSEGIMTVLKETSGGFVVSAAGTYKLQIMAIDPIGNVTMKTYVIVAEE